MDIDNRLQEQTFSFKSHLWTVCQCSKNFGKSRESGGLALAKSSLAEKQGIQMKVWLSIIASILVLSGCERSMSEIRAAGSRQEIKVSMSRAEAAACLVREYENQPRSIWNPTKPLAVRDFPSENLTELMSASGVVITALVDVRGVDGGSLITIYDPLSNALIRGAETTEVRLASAANSCRERAVKN
jgi:hypothetical protein